MAAVAAVLATAHFGLWWWTVRRIEAGLPEALAIAGSYGWQVTTESPRWAGWPTTARLRLGRVTALRPLGAATLRITSEDTDLELGPGDARALHLVPHGSVAATMGDAPALTLRTRRALVRVPLEAGPVTIALDGADLSGPAGRGASMTRLDAAVDGAGLQASATGVNAIPPFAAPFDAGGRLGFVAALTRPVPLAATPAASASAWQAAGGRLEVQDLDVAWGPLTLAGRLAGGLDAALQPAAEGEVLVTGLPELLEAANRAGVLSPASGLATRAVVNLLLRPAGAGPVRVPVTLADGTLTMARFPLLKLPPLDWGAR